MNQSPPPLPCAPPARLRRLEHWRLLLGFGLSVGLVLFSGWVSERMRASASAAKIAVRRSYEVFTQVESISDKLSALNAETLRRLSLASPGGTAYFEPMLEPTRPAWEKLAMLSQEQAETQLAIREFRAVFDARVGLLLEAMRRHDSPGASASSALDQLNLAHPSMYDYRQKLSQFQELERQHLALLTIRENTYESRASAAILGTSIVAAILLTTMALGLYRQKQRTALAEEARRQSDLRLNLALSAAAVGTWTWDIKNRTRYWDEQTCRLFGETTGVAPGDLESMLEAIHPDDRNRAWQEILAVLDGQGDYNVTYRVVLPGGEVRHLEVRGRVQHNELGELLAMMGTCVDVTQRERAAQELRRSLQEKEILLKEVHHRVKNNLQVIDSLLQMQSRAAADPACMRILAECQSRVRSMALIHQKLYQSGDFACINFADYISDLSAFLFLNYAVGQRVKFESAVAQMQVPLDTAIPIGLMLNELITNSLKYAFPDQRPGLVRVEALQQPDGAVRLCYRDNGVGLPREFEPAKAQSMGFKLVRLLARQIRAQLAIANDNGLEITLIFSIPSPLASPRPQPA